MRAVGRLAALMLLGPVTGPLALGALRYFRAGRWGMAIICAVGIAEFWVLAPLLLIKLTEFARQG